jgi:replicative DNA helicase
VDFDLAAEKALTLTLVLDRDAWDYVQPLGITAEMFGSEQGRAVFEGVRSVVQSGRAITPVTVQAAMQTHGKGGSAVPVWAKGSPVTRDEVVALAQRIRVLWEGREEVAEFGKAAELAKTDPRAAAESVSLLLARIQSKGAGGARSMGSMVYDWMTELEQQAKDPNAAPVFYDTGFAKLDQATGGLARGELSIFAARPGSGKSSFIVALAVNLAARGIPVGMFWLEDDWRDAVRRFLARRLLCEAWKLRGKPGFALNYVAGYENFLAKADLPIFTDDTHGLTITDIQARMRRMSREHGVKVFVLDHLGEVRIEREERWGDRHDLALGRITREYRDTAKSLGAVPVLVSQMNRNWEKRGPDALPQMSDLDGSGQVEQAARLISFVQMYRDETGASTGKGALHVTKATGGVTGSVGLRWNGGSMTWEDE